MQFSFSEISSFFDEIYSDILFSFSLNFRRKISEFILKSHPCSLWNTELGSIRRLKELDAKIG